MRFPILVCGAIGLVIGVLISQATRPAPPEEDPVASVGKAVERPHARDRQSEKARGDPGEKARQSIFDAAILEGKVDPADLRAMLDIRGNSKEALLSAALLTKDMAHLKTAAEKFPDDPQVQLMVIANGVFPDAKTEWIDRFKKSQPDNSLASLLKGGDLLDSGNTEQGLEELRLAASQPEFESFSTEAMLAMESSMIDLGYSNFEAKMKATFGLPLPELQTIRNTLNQLHPLAENAASDEERADLATLGIVLGNQLSQGAGNTTLINSLVGLAAEKKFLELLEPDFESPYLTATPADMLLEIEAARQEVRQVIEVGRRLPELSQAQITHYLDRLRSLGELEAIKWAEGQLE